MLVIENAKIDAVSNVVYVGNKGYKKQSIVISWDEGRSNMLVKVLNNNIDNFNIHRNQIANIGLQCEVKEYDLKKYNDIQIIKYDRVADNNNVYPSEQIPRDFNSHKSQVEPL